MMPGSSFVRLLTACLALTLTVACGTSTSVSDTTTDPDASCTNPNLILDGGGVVEVPEAGAPQCPAGVCNYQAQTGCPDGQACRPQFTAASPTVSPGCEPAGAGKSGAVCASGSDCAVGYFCVDRACRKQCCAEDRLACDPGESCFRPLEVKAGGTVIPSGMELCFPVNDCDPLDATSCSASPGSECKVVDATGAVACMPVSNAKLGDPCSAASACAAGALCVKDECRALCRAEPCAEPACAAGQGTCIHYNRDPAGVGECTPR